MVKESEELKTYCLQMAGGLIDEGPTACVESFCDFKGTPGNLLFFTLPFIRVHFHFGPSNQIPPSTKSLYI